MEVKRLFHLACGEAPCCGKEDEDSDGDYVRVADLLNAIKNPEIIWTGGEKMRVATVNGHRIGFVEKYKHDLFKTYKPMYRWDSRYTEKRSRPAFDTQKEGELAVEKAFRDWLAGVIKVV